ncbi:MAG: beta strand repeat-containing protein [Candidatus Limnocylindrus sp.]
MSLIRGKQLAAQTIDSRELKDGSVTANKLATAAQVLDFSNAVAVLVPDPTSPEHAATKSYVDSSLGQSYAPVGDEGVVQAAGDAGFAETPLRATYTATTPPAYAVEGDTIAFDSSSPSTNTLVLNRAHSFTVSGAGQSSGIWAIGVPDDGDVFTVTTTTFNPSPGYDIQIAVLQQYSTTGATTITRDFALKYASDPDDTASAVASTDSFGSFWLTTALAENSTYSFWYVQADDAWYYSDNGFPSAAPVISAATVEPAYVAGTVLSSGATMPVVNLGSATNRFGTLYLMGNTIDLGGTQLSANDGGQLVVSTDAGQTTAAYATESYVDAAVQSSEAALYTQLASKADASSTESSLNTLSQNISAEATARANADTVLASTIANVNTSLLSAIAAETTARQTAITAVQAALNNYVTIEAHDDDLALLLTRASFDTYVNGTLSNALAGKQDAFHVGSGLQLSANGTLSSIPTDLSEYVTSSELAAATLASKQYTDGRFDALVGSGTLTAALDTLVEIAAAIDTNQEAVDAINSAILTKADKSQVITAGAGIVTAGSLGAGVTVSLGTTAVTPGAYTTSGNVLNLSVDSYGRLTSVSVADAPAGFSGQYEDLEGAPVLSAVATSGLYSDLSGAPALSAVATSGQYDDLAGTPDLSGFVTSASLQAVDARVVALEESDFLTAVSTLSAANLDARTITVTTPSMLDTDLVLTLGASVTAASLAGVLQESLAIPRSLQSLNDVDISPALLVEGQYLKYDAASSKWIAGDVADFTTGVTSVNGATGAVSFEYISPAELTDALGDYATTAALADGLATKQATLSVGASLTLVDNTLDTAFDIADYATAATLSNYVTASDLETELALKLTASTYTAFINALPATLARKLDTETFAAFTLSYAAGLSQTSSSIAALASDISDLSASLANYALATDLANYATVESLTDYATAATLSNYATVGSLADYATTASLSAYATAATLSNYATVESLSDYATSATLSNYALSADVSSSLALKLDVATHTAYVGTVSTSLAALEASISGKQDQLLFGAGLTLTGSTLSANEVDLSGYATTGALSSAQSDLEDLIDAKQDSFSVGAGLSLTGATLSTSFSIDDYATSAQLSSSVGTINAALDLKLSISAFNTYTAGTLATQLNAKASVASLAAYTLANNTRVGAVEAEISALESSVGDLSGDILDLAGGITDLSSAITAEAAARANADTALQGAIDAKVSFTDALARSAISAGGDLSYNSGTGVMSYTSAWTQSSGVVSTTAPVIITGYMLELFDFGDAPLSQAPIMTLDGGNLSAPIDRIVDLGTLDQGRLF